MASIAVAFYFNVLLGIEVVYTHLFYVPIILAGVWYHRKAVYVALFLGVIHVLFNFMVDGIFTYDALVRAIILLAIAYIVGSIAEKKDTLYNVLKRSDEQLRQVYETLEQRVKERTAEISHTNESLRNEIIERERAEKALRESEEKFRILAESSPAAIMLYRGDKLIYVNHTAELITGYTKDELLSGMPWKFVHPDSRAMVSDRAAARLRGETVPSRYEVNIVTRSGEERWFDISAELIVYGGVPTGLVSGIDITDRKKAEKALIKSRAILSRAQSIAHVGNWAWDLKTNEMQWSDEIFRIFGMSKDLRPTCDWLVSHIHPEDRELFVQSAHEAIVKNKLFNIDFRIITLDGTALYINYVADKLRRDAEGRPAWMYGIVQDITARKQVEEALQEAKAQAELYLDLMGHDINNMNQIGIGFLELSLDTLGLDEYGRSLLSKSLSAFESSSRLIDNVRKLQKIRSGQLQQKEMDVGQVLADIQCYYKNLHGSSITINYEPASDCMVMADEMLYDLFSNLVGNAIKHSMGTPVINMVIETTTENGNKYYRVAIEDNGPGISDEFKVIIFNRHLRNSAKAKGSGIGLYLVKALADNYKGRVWVEDHVPCNRSNGSRFMVMLPASGKK